MIHLPSYVRLLILTYAPLVLVRANSLSTHLTTKNHLLQIYLVVNLIILSSYSRIFCYSVSLLSIDCCGSLWVLGQTIVHDVS